MQSKVVATLVIGLGIVVAAAVLIRLAIGSEPDYADLVPAPDAVVWEVGNETALWLSTNRRDVDARIRSVALGVGGLHRAFPESGEALALGRGEGCLDWAVSELESYGVADYTGGKQVSLQGAIERDGTTGALDVYLRVYPKGADIGDLQDLTSNVQFRTAHADGSNHKFQVSAGSSTYSGNDYRYKVPVTSGVWVFEASHDSRFPIVNTHRIEVEVSENVVTASVIDVADVRILQHGGVGFIACSENDTVLVTLHGEDGEELNRYWVSVHDRPAAPRAVPPPDAGYNIRRVCVDSADHQINYLSGSEQVGASFDNGGFGLSGTIQSAVLEDIIQASHYQYFFASTLSSGEVQLQVTDVGASSIGLDADQVYPVRLTATDNSGVADDPDTEDINEFVPDATAHLDVGVWVDKSTLSPGDDGLCS